MRGIVMAEVGELDHLLDEILTIGVEYLPDEQQKAIFTRFHKAVSKQEKDESELLDEFIRNPTTA